MTEIHKKDFDNWNSLKKKVNKMGSLSKEQFIKVQEKFREMY
jgi:hypothetical protein